MLVRILLLFLAVFTASAHAQVNIGQLFSDREEIYFQFQIQDTKEIETLTRIISIDRVEGGLVTAFATKDDFLEFLKHGYDFTVLPSPEKNFFPLMLDYVDVEAIQEWNFYPTYQAYEQMMFQFQANHPALCTIINIGTLPSGRKLLGARITSSVISDEMKPQFLYSATMHGDETAGYILSLRLIHHLLTNYSTDPAIARLVDSVEIWIFPLANPDGTYRSGNHTVAGARRGNANNVDLNRNYPDPQAGPNPDGNAWQPETVAFKQLAQQNRFGIGANLHGGAEVANYPWDTWQHLTADNSWWVYVCREYADTVHAFSPPGYFTFLNNGITNGYAWYSIKGGRQDYMNYFHNCREFTLELSNTKLVPASQLPAFWEYNYRSLLNYLEQSLYGVRGIVTDSITGEPVKAKIFINGHDIDNSHVYSSTSSGAYFRYLFQGTYNITFSSPCHKPKTVTVTVENRQTDFLNVQLAPTALSAAFASSSTSIEPEQQIQFSDLSCGNPVWWQWTFEGGIPSVSYEQNPTVIYPSQGAYGVGLTVFDGIETHSVYFPNFILVGLDFLMSNGSATVCSAIFYDSGGAQGNYFPNENSTFTFFPGHSAAKIKVEFTHFDVEAHATCSFDWLRVFNGANISAPLLGTWCGINSPGTIIATNTSGALTFQFKSDNSANRSGWVANISCVYPLAPPVANFAANQTQLIQGDTIQFSDLTTGYPETWIWSFPGGTPSSSASPNPTVIYQTPGVYDVTLTVTNNIGSNTKTIVNYIHVDTGTSIVDPYLKKKVYVSPNPVTGGQVKIKSDYTMEVLEIISLTGQKALQVRPQSNNILLDVSALKSGFYILVIRGSTEKWVQKLIIY